MYFESRSHSSRPVASLEKAVRLIYEGKDWYTYQVPIFNNSKGERIGLVPDGHINNPSFEMAIVNLDTKTQIESITFSWIKTVEETIESVRESVEHSALDPDHPDYFSMFKPGTLKISIDGEGKDVEATFECGCCGEFFQSTIAIQQAFDQDAGFGICPSCDEHAASVAAA